MKLEIILLLIAVQVVYGVMAKRKAKQKALQKAEERARAPGASGSPAALGHPASVRAPARQPEAVLGGHTSYDEDEEAEEWDEHHLRGESPEARPAAQGKASELGKDLLSQLAKELGIPLPDSQPRKQAPAPMPRPAPAAMTRPVPSPKLTTLAMRAAEKRVVKSHTDRPVNREGGESAPRRAPGNIQVTEEPQIRSLSDLARESLGDAQAIRRAFILKTILDKPLSLQPRIPGQG